MSTKLPGRITRAGGSSGIGRTTPAVRAGCAAAGADGADGAAARTGVASPSACWKKARWAALASAELRTGAWADGFGWGVTPCETIGGLNGRMTAMALR